MFLNLEKQNQQTVAIKDNEGACLTYGALVDEIGDFYPAIESRAVAFILCKNTVGSMLGYLAMVERGVVPLVLNNAIDADLLRTFMNTYTPAYLWVPVERAGDFDGDTRFERYGYVLIRTHNDVYPIHEALQLLMATSGSTGSPKLVRYKKGNLEANARNVAKAFEWTSAERPVCDLGMQYTMGLNVINTHLYVGATVLLTTYNLMSGDFWNYIKQERATNFTGVPFSYEIFYRLHFERMDLPDLRTLSQGGGKLTDTRFVQLAEYAQRTGKRFIASFGTTETSARMACLPAELALSKTGSIGKAIPEGELFLIDENGNRLDAPVAEGEMCYRGPNVTMGYALCKEDLAAGDAFNGEYHTGDLARRDEDGCYFVTGRMSRFLKLLSYRVSLDQCERLIQQAFDIECACAGTDERMNIYITDGSKAEEVLAFIAQKTNLFKTLFKVIEVPQILRNDSGKIRYRAMDEAFGA